MGKRGLRSSFFGFKKIIRKVKISVDGSKTLGIIRLHDLGEANQKQLPS